VERWSPRGLPDLAQLCSRTCTCMPSLRRVPTATAAQVSTRWFSKAPKPDPDRGRAQLFASGGEQVGPCTPVWTR
jgi:hypothetical protein